MRVVEDLRSVTSKFYSNQWLILAKLLLFNNNSIVNRQKKISDFFLARTSNGVHKFLKMNSKLDL